MEDILKKVRALLLKAEGTIGPESDAFMSKVRDLMAKHQIEMHQLRQEPDPLGQHNQGILIDSPWAMGVCHVGAEYLGCAAVFTQLEGTTIGCKLYGRRSACLTAMEMLMYWINEVKRMAALYDLDAQAIGDALALRFSRILEQDGPAPSNGTDLVPIDEAKAAANNGGAVETKEVVVKASVEAIIVAENISLHLQTGGVAKHKEISQ